MMTSAPPATRVSEIRIAPRAGALLALAALLVVATACGGAGTSAPVSGYADNTSAAQMDFGVRMAQRGLWNEALFRFQRAQRLTPGDPEILNNLAVAYEATGQYEEALTSYQQALQAAPANRELRRNYARFVEFYQSFRPAEEGDGEAAVGASDGSATGDDAAASEVGNLSLSLAAAR